MKTVLIITATTLTTLVLYELYNSSKVLKIELK